MKKKFDKKYIIIPIFLVLMVVVIFTLGKTLAFFNYEKEGETTNVITFNGLDVEIINSSDNALNITNAYPMHDSQGMELDSFDFNINNYSNKSINYTLKVENDADKQNNCIVNGSVCPQLSTNYIKYSYKLANGSWSEPANLGTNNNIVFSNTILGNETLNVSIKIWIDSQAGNEIEDRVFFGKLILEATKSQIDGIRVTFDANGGSISSSSKIVTPGETYGELPTPTRNGYTFKGWNGNNKFDAANIITGYEILGTEIVENQDWFVSDYIAIDSDNNYTISGSGRAILTYDINKTYIERVSLSDDNTIQFNSNVKYIKVNGEISNVNNFKIEEGSTATSYEPYYITSSTEVVQTENHTLTAIWEAN